MAKSYKVTVFTGSKILAAMTERAEMAVIGASVEAKPLVGGESLSNAVVIPKGPVDSDRKWELSAGKWYIVNGTARQIDNGKRWIAWWDHLSDKIDLKEMGDLPDGSANVPLWESQVYKKGDMVSDLDGNLYVSYVDNNIYNLNDTSKWKKNGSDIVVVDGFDSNSILEAASAKNASVLNKTKIDKSEKGLPNGVASLGGNGKIRSTQIDLTGLNYQGLWDADSNTPPIINGIGKNGDFYMVSIPGNQNLGNGEINYKAFSYVIYANGVWEENTGTRAIAPAEFSDYFGL